MTAVSEEDRLRRARLPAVLDYAFRPMFLAAGSWAVIALALWLAMFFGYVQLPTRFDPLAWHVHEMLFGFVMAAVAGFLLTAIPNWTGRLPVRGLRLAALAGLWLLGRLACLISADLARVAGGPCRSGVSHRAARRRRPRNHHRAQLAQPADDSASHALHYCRSANAPRIARCRRAHRAWLAPRHQRAHRADLGHWRAHHSELHAQLAVQAQESASSLTSGHARYRCRGLLAAALILWAFLPDHRVTGALLIAVALLNAVRLGRWAGIASWPEPLLFILHVGYGWVVWRLGFTRTVHL